MSAVCENLILTEAIFFMLGFILLLISAIAFVNLLPATRNSLTFFFSFPIYLFNMFFDYYYLHLIIVLIVWVYVAFVPSDFYLIIVIFY